MHTLTLSAALVASTVVSAFAFNPGEGHGPPPEFIEAAQDACSDKSEGASCSFTHDDHTIEGECQTAPHDEDGTLECRPSGPPPRPDGDPPSE